MLWKIFLLKLMIPNFRSVLTTTLTTLITINIFTQLIITIISTLNGTLPVTLQINITRLWLSPFKPKPFNKCFYHKVWISMLAFIYVHNILDFCYHKVWISMFAFIYVYNILDFCSQDTIYLKHMPPMKVLNFRDKYSISLQACSPLVTHTRTLFVFNALLSPLSCCLSPGHVFTNILSLILRLRLKTADLKSHWK